MWNLRTVCPLGLLLVLAACSGQGELSGPPKKTGGTSNSNSGGKGGPTSGGAVGTGTGGVVSQSGAAALGGSTTAPLAGGNTGTTGGVGTGGLGTGGSTGGQGTGGRGTGGVGTAGLGTAGSTVGNTGGMGTGGVGTGGSGLAGGSSVTGTGGAGGSCVETSGQTKAVPPILEFTIDNTQSMSDTAPSTGGQTKMECTRTALSAAFPQLPTDYAVGMTYYHVRSGPCNDALQAVEIAPMATNVQPLVNSITTQQQIQMTPSQDAWQFAYDYLMAFNAATISTATVDYTQATRYVVVMTDGVPTQGANCTDSQGCGQGISEAQYQPYIDAVAAAFAQGVQTFFIGVPGSENTNQVMCGTVPEYDPRTKLSELAVAGGTAKPGCNNAGPVYCHIDLTDPNINFVTELQNAIQAIASTVASCEYPVPTPPAGLVVDKNKVEIRYYANGSTTYQTIVRSDGCTDPNGWQYQDATQTNVVLCPDACATVQADPNARVEVYFGCLSFL
jgi:hypothetical protein